VTGFSRDDEGRLLELLSQEYELFKQIRGLAGEQTELLAADEAIVFGRSFDRAQEFVEQINGLHQESDILMQSYVSFSATPNGGKVAPIEEAAEKLRNVIAECIEINKKNEASAKEISKDYVKRIDKSNTTRKGLGKYIHNLPNNPELFDKKM